MEVIELTKQIGLPTAMMIFFYKFLLAQNEKHYSAFIQSNKMLLEEFKQDKQRYTKEFIEKTEKHHVSTMKELKCIKQDTNNIKVILSK